MAKLLVRLVLQLLSLMAELTALVTALALTDHLVATVAVVQQYFVEAHAYVMQVEAAVEAAQVTHPLLELQGLAAAKAKAVAEDQDHQAPANQAAHHLLDSAEEAEAEAQDLHQTQVTVNRAEEAII
jgi:hypothetical protein